MNPPEFKEKFKKKYSKLLGDELETFLEWSLKPLQKTIRVNTNKITRKKLITLLEKKGWTVKPLKYYENGLKISNNNTALGNTLEHFLGYYYVQESASMLPPIILNPEKNESILDSCAAPGSKTTQLSMMMENKGIIVANDVSIGRVKILSSNLQRTGCENVIITRNTATSFHVRQNEFDKILVDAPCSATGAIRKKYDIIRQWNENTPIKMCGLQKQILYSCLQALKKGGELVYSTCTLEPEENENVVNHAIKKFGVKLLPAKIKGFKTRPGITNWDEEKYDPTIKKCARIYPQDNNTEGFFIAKMKK
ncbi:MAG: RsmB/NOP family class I SAM-dependent RNA methyltransferase [Nanoarchaeota archaeon]|nr:RsmB/NOP family class I SAM-dependent RNA methyltransferase [Nanoarchaeota archaeon]